MNFFDVAYVFDKLEQTSSRTEITVFLADLFKKLSAQELSFICNLSLGQLHPPYIGTQFNIATKSMLKIVAQVASVSIDEIKQELKMYGDLGTVIAAYEWAAQKNLSIEDVYQQLVKLETIHGVGSQEEKSDLLQSLLLSLSCIEAKYVVRMVLGKLRLGFSDMTIVDALSWMEVGNKSLRAAIEQAYNVCADIGLIGKTLKEDGIAGIERMSVHVGIPIRPAAAERLPTAKTIVEKLGDCVAQPKLDGFRLQIHIDKTEQEPRIYFYSRNLQDMSEMFPDLVRAFTQLDVKTLVCEGEAICYDQNSGNFLKFQETVKRKRKHGIEDAVTEYPLKVFLFDLLFVNGNEMLSTTHAERRAKLKDITEKLQSSEVQLIEEKKIKTAQELETYFIGSIATGLEGLVVKREDAIYQPGKRNFNWIKLKRQEEGHLEDTIDCVILGYYLGQGKRSAFGVGALLVGIYNKALDCFQTIAKIGTGLSDEGWRLVKKKSDEFSRDGKPHNVMCHKNLTPDAWVDPVIVCVVRADEITQSPVHTAGKTDSDLGYALRFPRFIEYRQDKHANDATTVKEIRRLYEDQFLA